MSIIGPEERFFFYFYYYSWVHSELGTWSKAKHYKLWITAAIQNATSHLGELSKSQTETTATCWKPCNAAIWLALLLLSCTFKLIWCLRHLSLSVSTSASSSSKYLALDHRMKEQPQYVCNSDQFFPMIYAGATPAQKNLAHQASQLNNRTLYVVSGLTWLLCPNSEMTKTAPKLPLTLPTRNNEQNLAVLQHSPLQKNLYIKRVISLPEQSRKAWEHNTLGEV